jgi:hypothetical protein
LAGERPEPALHDVRVDVDVDSVPSHKSSGMK